MNYVSPTEDTQESHRTFGYHQILRALHEVGTENSETMHQSTPWHSRPCEPLDHSTMEKDPICSFVFHIARPAASEMWKVWIWSLHQISLYREKLSLDASPSVQSCTSVSEPLKCSFWPVLWHTLSVVIGTESRACTAPTAPSSVEK